MTVQASQRPFMVLTVREDGDETGGDYWLPTVDPGANAARLTAGEQLLCWIGFLSNPGEFGFGGFIGVVLISAYATYVYRGGRWIIF